jgi:hypothetical protein
LIDRGPIDLEGTNIVILKISPKPKDHTNRARRCTTADNNYAPKEVSRKIVNMLGSKSWGIEKVANEITTILSSSRIHGKTDVQCVPNHGHELLR